MPARETETAQTETETAPEVAPEPAAATDTAFSTEGDVPEIAPEVALAGVTASELAFEDAPKATPDAAHLDKGIHHWESYRAACEAAGKPEKWKDYYQSGHTEAKGWKQPYEGKVMNDWTLKKGHSASAALKAWLAGPTISDYRAALLADEIDEVRDELGDQRFDRLFGSANEHEDKAIPATQRLRISSDLYTTPFADQLKAIAKEADQKALVDHGPLPAPVVEARVEEKKPEAALQEQDPVVVAQELHIEQRDREIV